VKEILQRRDVEAESNLKWNRFVAFLANANLTKLEPVQRPAFLVFWYDSEVLNGGHLQFFLNRPEQPTQETIAALERISSHGHANVLREALELLPLPRVPASVTEYVETALEGRFDELDRAYYLIVPSIADRLEEYLEANFGEFFELVD
jgi:hypothetical protein